MVLKLLAVALLGSVIYGQLITPPPGGGGGGAGATVYVSPSGDTTGAADSAAIATAYGSGGKLVHLETSVGAFYINSTISMANPGSVECDGEASNPIEQTVGTIYYFTITYNEMGGGATSDQAGLVRNCQLKPKSGVTPTAGGGFLMGSGNAGYYTQNAHVENVLMNSLWSCYTLQTGLITDWVTGSTCANAPSGGNCIYYDDAVPGGDQQLEVNCLGPNENVIINQSDRTTIRALKINGGGGLIFNGAGVTNLMTFNNASIEGLGAGTSACGVDFGTGTYTPTQIQFLGGEVALFTTAFCNGTLAFTNGTAELVGTIVKGVTNLFGNLPVASPYMYNIGAQTNNCGGYQTFDSFVGGSGTDLASHVDNCFHTWAQYANGPDSASNHITLNGTGGAVYTVNSGNAFYYNLLTPASPNYTVSLNCTSTTSGSSGTICFAAGRISTAAYTAYIAINVGGTCQLFVENAGTPTQIGSNVSCGWNAGVTHRIGLSMQGTTITLLIDGVATAATGTDSSISAAGYAGMRVGGNSGTINSQFSVQ